MPTRVELDLFSGRPNPAWQLSADEAAAFSSRIAGLPAAEQMPARDALGYRGILVFTHGEGAPRSVKVRDGIVSVEQSGDVRSYRDTRQIERWLLETGRVHGHGAIVDEVLKGLG
jgi:hypothetical protein